MNQLTLTSKCFVPGAEQDYTTMPNELLLAELRGAVSAETVLRQDEPLAKRTTLRVGGSADFYCEPASEEELAQVLKICGMNWLPIFMLGRGSNLLIRDGGIRGMVICLANAKFSRIEVAGYR